MRVLFDAHMVGQQETGNETYIVNLLEYMVRFPDVVCGAVVHSQSELPVAIKQSNRIEIIPLHSNNNWHRLGFELPQICRRWKADLLHVTYISPFFKACPIVTSVHDVVFKPFPSFFPPRDRLLFHTLFPWTLRKANKIITISNFSKYEILRYYPFLSGKVDVTYLAASNNFRMSDDIEICRQITTQYGLSPRFVLAVGNLQPRKNLYRLVQAFADVKAQIRDLTLVIVGKAQWRSSEIFNLVEEWGLQREVIFTGYVSDQQLVALYNAATVFVYPSIYEGFGIPILEAMTCGTPVIASNTSSMPEIAGDAAILINPYSTQSITDALLRVLTDHRLAESLSERGLKNIERFSWQKTAELTLKIYEDTLEKYG